MAISLPLLRTARGEHRARARDWARQAGIPQMLRCQRIWVHPDVPDSVAACCLLPNHDGRCRRISYAGTVHTIDKGWIRA